MAETISYDVVSKNLKKFFLRISIHGDNCTFKVEIAVWRSLHIRRELFFLNIKKIKIGNCSIYVHICISLELNFSKILNINGMRPFPPRIFLSARSYFFTRKQRIRGMYLSVYRECAESIQVYMEYTANVGLFAVHRIFSKYAERIYAYMEKTQRDSWRILLIRQ